MNSKAKHDLRVAIAEAIVKIAKQESRPIKSLQLKSLATTAIREVYKNEETLTTDRPNS